MGAGVIEFQRDVAVSDQVAFEVLWREQHERLLRLAVLLTSDRTVAEDLCSEAFARVYPVWPDVRGNGAAQGYLRTTLVNLVRDHFKHQLVVFKHYVPPKEAYDPPDTPTRLDVLAALQKLPLGQRECVVCRHLLDLSEADTAITLEIEIGTVKSQTFKGLERLRQMLEPGDPSD